MTTLDTARVSTPIGPILLFALGDSLVGLEFDDRDGRTTGLRERLARHLGPFDTRQVPDPAGASTRLARFFSGDVRALEDQCVRMLGTDFERSVWEQLRKIPVGKTVSYAELATRVGRPKGPRAVGQANGRNPIALFVPCHRVIASDGTLGGYGGGLERKQALLEHEGALGPHLVPPMVVRRLWVERT